MATKRKCTNKFIDINFHVCTKHNMLEYLQMHFAENKNTLTHQGKKYKTHRSYGHDFEYNIM